MYHIMHLRFLAVEIFKIFKDLNPIFITEIFCYKETKHFLRSSNLLKLPETKSKRYGTNSVFFRGCLLWNSLSDEVKQVMTRRI